MISRRRQLYWFIILPFIVIIGCNELLAPEPERLGYEYFPLTVGEFRIYDVEVINYNSDGSTDSVKYQLKEVVADSSIIGEETSYRLNRFRRPTAQEIWVIDSVWTARLNTYQAIVVEHNVPIIKLSFPLAEDRRWNGNAMNSRDFDEFKIKNLGMAFQTNGVDYPNTLQMFKEELRDPLGITKDDYHVEVFSAGQGLIYRLDEDLSYCDDCPDRFTIEEGRIYEQKLLEIGKDE